MTWEERVQALINIISWHEERDPHFTAADYSDDQWNAITDAIVALHDPDPPRK